MKISFSGGTDEVTGSRHFLELERAQILLDCGLFQGHRREALEKNRKFQFNPQSLSAVLLSHAHLDHSGSLPLLVKRGFTGKIHCAKPTRQIVTIMLMDSAYLQEEDAKFFNKIHQRDGQKIEPLYTRDDVWPCLEQIEEHAYGEYFEPAPGVRVRFLDAGHVLGSAMIELNSKILFTGDLGRRHSLMMNPPSAPAGIETLLMESTYGNRTHPPLGEIENKLCDIICRAAKEGGKILIPSFALERAQEIIYILDRLRRAKRLPDIPFFVDSPMAVNLTEIFNRHLSRQYFSNEFISYVERYGSPFTSAHIRYVAEAEESKKINELAGPAIILAGSGMCEGGRILHHLRNHIHDPNTAIILVGFQVEGTLGRRLMEGVSKVKIFGLDHETVAQVYSMDHLSSHADKEDLISFAERVHPRKLFLVHGSGDARLALKETLGVLGLRNVSAPLLSQTVSA